MEKEDRIKILLRVIEASKERGAQERKMRSRAEANDKYNPRCPKCGLRVLLCVYGNGPDKIEEYDQRGIMCQRMGCYIPPNRYYYICPDCKIGYDRKLRKIDDPWLSQDKTMKR